MVAYVRLDYAWQYNISIISYNVMYNGFRVFYYARGNCYCGKCAII